MTPAIGRLSNTVLPPLTVTKKTLPKIVCLGFDCCMRTLMTKLAYKPSKLHGELSLPFDLAIHSYDAMCKYISNDFKDYFKDITWQSDYCEVRQKVINNMVNDQGVFFVHESHLQNKEETPAFDSDTWSSKPSDIDFFANNFALLKQRYFQRMANFYNVLGDGSEVVFVLSSHCDVDMSFLNDIIKQKFPALNYKIYCLRIYFSDETSIPFDKFVFDNMIINSCKLTTPGFWNTDDANRLIVENILKDDLSFVC